MAISMNKLAPRAVVLAVVGYCAWPSLLDLSTETKPKAVKKGQELSASLFAPKLAPAPTQNPWGGKDAATLLAERKPAKPTAGAGGAKDSSKGEAEKPVDPLDGLALEGTSIAGDFRMAVVNGRLYSHGDYVENKPGCKIVEVLPYKIVLEHEGKTLELVYTDSNKRRRDEAPDKDAKSAVPADVGAGVASNDKGK